jgi:hypothetical protein
VLGSGERSHGAAEETTMNKTTPFADAGLQPA